MKFSIETFLKKKIKHGFDDWSATYSKDVVPKLIKRGYSYEQLAKLIINHLSPPLSSTIIEIGVGSGVLGKEIKKLREDINIIGVDISFGMLSKSKLLDIYVDLYQCDAEVMPFKSKTISGLYTAFMFHSALNPQRCLKEIHRVCNDGAKVAFIDLFREKKRIPLFSKIIDNFHSYKYEHGAPSCYHKIEEMISLLLNAGYSLRTADRLDTGDYSPVGSMGHYFMGLSKGELLYDKEPS